MTSFQLERIERYYDTVPRASARPEEIGPFTLFVSTLNWPYYARPRLGCSDAVTTADVAAVRARQRELKVVQSFEWVQELTPQLLAPAQASGLEVGQFPLMVLQTAAASPVEAPKVRILAADDSALAAACAVQALGFASEGSAVGDVGTRERDARVAAGESALPYTPQMLRNELIVFCAAEDESGPLCAGAHLPRGDVTEIVGVATLPSARRRGLGAAVTAGLVSDARKRGVDLIFLTAGSQEIARIYEKVGFRRVATACIATAPTAQQP